MAVKKAKATEKDSTLIQVSVKNTYHIEFKKLKLLREIEGKRTSTGKKENMAELIVAMAEKGIEAELKERAKAEQTK